MGIAGGGVGEPGWRPEVAVAPGSGGARQQRVSSPEGGGRGDPQPGREADGSGPAQRPLLKPPGPPTQRPHVTFMTPETKIPQEGATPNIPKHSRDANGNSTPTRTPVHAYAAGRKLAKCKMVK